MLKIMEIKSHETKLTQKQICNQLRFSDSTIRRYRDDINVHSPYKWNNYKKRTTKRKTKTNNNSTQKLPKNENSKSTTNKKLKIMPERVVTQLIIIWLQKNPLNKF